MFEDSVALNRVYINNMGKSAVITTDQENKILWCNLNVK